MNRIKYYTAGVDICTYLTRILKIFSSRTSAFVLSRAPRTPETIRDRRTAEECESFLTSDMAAAATCEPSVGPSINTRNELSGRNHESLMIGRRTEPVRVEPGDKTGVRSRSVLWCGRTADGISLRSAESAGPSPEQRNAGVSEPGIAGPHATLVLVPSLQMDGLVSLRGQLGIK